MKPYFLENSIQLPRNLINIFNASLNLYKNNFRSTLTISFAATFIQFFSHDFVLRFLSNLLLKLETIHVVPGIMSIIKKKRGEKGGGNRKKRGKKNDNAEAGIFFPLLPSALPQWLLFEKLFPSGDGSHWKWIVFVHASEMNNPTFRASSYYRVGFSLWNFYRRGSLLACCSTITRR